MATLYTSVYPFGKDLHGENYKFGLINPQFIASGFEYCFFCPHRIHLEKEQTFGSELNFVLGRKCDQIWRFFKVLGEKIVKKSPKSISTFGLIENITFQVKTA